jgi:hypothetical protein
MIPSHGELHNQMREEARLAFESNVLTPFLQEITNILGDTYSLDDAVFEASNRNRNMFIGWKSVAQIYGHALADTTLRSVFLGESINRPSTLSINTKLSLGELYLVTYLMDTPLTRRYLRRLSQDIVIDILPSKVLKVSLKILPVCNINYTECVEAIRSLETFVRITDTIARGLPLCKTYHFPIFQSL